MGNLEIMKIIFTAESSEFAWISGIRGDIFRRELENKIILKICIKNVIANYLHNVTAYPIDAPECSRILTLAASS